MRTELISIPTETIPLDGAFHTPESGAAHTGVLLFHGNTMNFYVGAPRFLPPVLTPQGYACLAFNRRGHDILSVRNSRAAEGAAFQLTADGIADNVHAAHWMAQRGFPAPVVIGHSNGGMLGIVHAAAHPETPAMVLLSAHRGGVGSPSSRMQANLAGERTEEFMAKARAMIAEGRGQELMLVPGWWYVISAESFVDRMTTMPEVVDLAPRITCPVLYIRGDQEVRDAYPAEEYAERAGGPCTVEIIPNCDHFYNGCEQVVTDIVSSWLADVVKTRAAAE